MQIIPMKRLHFMDHLAQMKIQDLSNGPDHILIVVDLTDGWWQPWYRLLISTQGILDFDMLNILRKYYY